MTDCKPTAAEHEALRARVSALSAASLRISASLDLETVLNEVAGSARALTGARFAAIATIDETGAPQDFVTSGFTEEAHRAIAEWPDGPRLFEHFRDLPGPLRIADVPAFVRELGFPADRLPSKTFQGTPMRHRGVQVGNFYSKASIRTPRSAHGCRRERRARRPRCRCGARRVRTGRIPHGGARPLGVSVQQPPPPAHEPFDLYVEFAHPPGPVHR